VRVIALAKAIVRVIATVRVIAIANIPLIVSTPATLATATEMDALKDHRAGKVAEDVSELPKL
jgi:hypothetical protein